jgi:hypothetical protein
MAEAEQVHRLQAEHDAVVGVEQFGGVGEDEAAVGLDRDRRVLMVVVRSRSLSPGRTGTGQRSSSIPGEARLATRDRQWPANSRMKIPPVCQPLAISPPNGPTAAKSASAWIGCGSNRRTG